jgi:DNA-binding transcriptional regulator YhcF (GntR family)
MNSEFFNHIKINEESRIPKYRQIVEEITYHISFGTLHMGQKIPSINSFSENYYLSRDTVEKAYNILKDAKLLPLSKERLLHRPNTAYFQDERALFGEQVEYVQNADLQLVRKCRWRKLSHRIAHLSLR